MDPKTSARSLPVLAFILLAGLFSRFSSASPVSESGLRADYKAALVVDHATNEVIYADRAREPADPASLVKMMVTLITLERVEAGLQRLDEQVRISSKASEIGGHQVYLMQGEVFSLHELLKAVIIASANDASFAVAEHAAGSQQEFVRWMNARALELGMHDTRFANAHGLPPNRRKGEKENSTSAYDLYLLARELMKHPAAMEWASTQTSPFRNGKFLLVNTNRRFLQRFEGADGFKTGYHPRGAGFNVVATAKRNGRRLVAVVLGAKSSRNRLHVATTLLEWGFDGKFERQAHQEHWTIPVARTASVDDGRKSN